MTGRLRYTEPTFTLPATNKAMTDLEYNLRVGAISQEQYDAEVTKQQATTSPQA